MRADRFEDRVALVVGSTAGIGLEIAKGLANESALVILNSRGGGDRQASSEALAASLGERCEYLSADVTDQNAVAELVSKIKARHGKLDVLVLSGGSSVGPQAGPDRFAEMPIEQISLWFELQMLSRLRVLHESLDLLRQGTNPSVVFITTDAGRIPTTSELAPGAAGAALILSTKVLAKELGREGIRVNAVATTVTPGTPGGDRVKGEDIRAQKVFAAAMKRQLFELTATHTANAALFLASDEGGAITGQVLSVNGGLSFPG